MKKEDAISSIEQAFEDAATISDFKQSVLVIVRAIDNPVINITIGSLIRESYTLNDAELRDKITKSLLMAVQDANEMNESLND